MDCKMRLLNNQIIISLLLILSLSLISCGKKGDLYFEDGYIRDDKKDNEQL